MSGPKLIDAQKVQRAHDILIEVVTGRVPVMDHASATMRDLHSALDAICWVLGHAHNTAFASNLALVESLVEEAGYELINTGRLQVGRPKL